MRLPRVFRILFWLAAFVTTIAIINDSRENAWDFRVFYVAARELLHGNSPYLTGMDNGWVFKYPPWILPLFLPFSFLPFDVARLLWGVLQVLCIFFSFRWVLKQGVSFTTTAWVSLAFWFIWTYHALSGQFTVIMLAIALLSVNEGTLPSSRLKDSLRLALLFWSQTSKIFSAFSLLGLIDRRFPTLRTLAQHLCVALLWLIGASLPAIFLSSGTLTTDLLYQWFQAAGSSSTVQNMEAATRGWRNQGFPAALLRLFHIDASTLSMDIGMFLILALLCGLLWHQIAKKESWAVRWSGWLALGTAIHPLAWFSSYVLAFPLACFAIDRAFEKPASGTSLRKQRLQKTFAVMGLLMITVVTRNSFSIFGLGSVGRFLELASVKAWGVLFCAVSLWGSSRTPATPRTKVVHFITGEINTGKTTRLRALFAGFQAQAKSNGNSGFAGGFILEKAQEGYDAVNLNSSERCPVIRRLENLPAQWKESLRFSKFSFSADGLNFCRKIFDQSVAQKHRIFFIDEIGPVELSDRGFSKLLQEALQTMDELYVVCRSSCLEEVIRKFEIPEDRIRRESGAIPPHDSNHALSTVS